MLLKMEKDPRTQRTADKDICMKRLIVYTKILLIGLLCACTSTKEAKSVAPSPSAERYSEPLLQKLQDVLFDIPNARFQPIRQGWQHDYGFAEGGMLNSFEYIRSLIDFQTLQSLLPVEIYVSGPHSREALNLNAPYAFGHHNPEFVRYLHIHLSELLSAPRFVESTKANLWKRS